jgi:hypothetical protein
MARAGAKRENSKKDAPPTLCDPLAHPVRTRILDILNEETMSPVRFLDDGYCPIEFKARSTGLSYVAYHFRELEKAGCIELVERVPVRGAVEHIYRGVRRVYFTDEEFARLPLKRRQQLSRSSLQGLIARTDGAIQSGTFDKRPDRVMAWRGANVDQRGWDEIKAILDGAFAKAEAAREEAELRLAVPETEGAQPIPLTMAVLGFESPPRKLRF